MRWLDVFKGYFEGSIYPIVLVLLIFFLVKRKNILAKKLVVSCVIYLLFIPIVYMVCSRVDLASVTYRLLWVFPLSIIVAVLAVDIIEKSERKKIALCLVILIEMLLLGNVALYADAWKVPDNLYLLDDEIVQIGNLIENDSGGEMTIVVGELDFMGQIRQYSPRVCWGYTNRKYMMNADESHTENASYRIAGAIQNHYYPDGMSVIGDLEELAVDYIIIYRDNPFQNHLPEESYEIVGNTENYRVLRMNYSENK